MTETARLAFIEERDGIAAAIEFSKRTMQLYRKCVLMSRKRGYDKPHHASLPEYRRTFIASYLSFKSYLRREHD